MKKEYESPEVHSINFHTEEALMASVIDSSGAGSTEIGTEKVPLW